MTEAILTVDNLSKHYGSLKAVNRLCLEINKGEIFGLLGPNGSGKTTTLGMLLDVISPTDGTYRWFGQGKNSNQRKRIGAILEKPNFYPNFSASKNLSLVCKIKEADPARLPAVLETVGLYARKDDNFKTYSLGMKQRLAIASALLNNPEVLILDEPTNGLDPEGIAEIRQLIIDIASTGKTIILASHLLGEVQKICSTFAVLKSGKLIHHGRVDEDFGDHHLIHVAHPDMEKLQAAVKAIPDILSFKRIKSALEISVEKETDLLDLSRKLSEADCHPTLFAPQKKSLEQQFIDILSQNA